jgi:DNA-binding NarL/FixJ family response regulator
MAPNPALRLDLETGPLHVLVLARGRLTREELADRVGVRSDILISDRVADAQIALLDATGGESALDVLDELDIPVVVLTDTQSVSKRAIARGARGAIAPDASGGGLVAALVAAMNGLTVIDTPPDAHDKPDHPKLTRRERQVLDLVARGFSNKHIAELLEISEHTVKFHVGGILGKLGAATRAEAVAIAAREQLLG